MKTKLSILFAIIAWFAVVTQYYLMIENRIASIPETTIRFFSFFTILTNLMVATYFTLSVVKKKSSRLSIINTSGTLTAVTVYIFIVGLVYQILLRHIWEPKGMQRIVDELLHSILPILVLVFWYVYEEKIMITYKSIPYWLVYPLIYLTFILIRGYTSNFYPYPFIDVTTLGLKKVLVNSSLLMLLFVFISAGFITLGKTIKKKEL